VNVLLVVLKSNTYIHSLIFVFFAGVLWSTVGLGIRLIEGAGVWQILFYRSISLTLLLYTVIHLRGGSTKLVSKELFTTPKIIGGLSLVAAYAGGIFAIQTTSVANAMLLFATAPFIAAILASLFLGEKVRIMTWCAVIVAMGGIAYMFADQSTQFSLIGSLAALGSAMGFAIFSVALRWGKDDEMLPAVFLSGCFAIIITFLICLFLKQSLSLSFRDIAISFSMGIFQVGGGLVLYTIGSKALSAADLTLLSLAEVVLGPVWVWLFLGELASNNTLIGGSILLLAIITNAVSGKRWKPPPIM
jgi:DME family drug/metabolite transporter|tara:strand:- start:16 stop:924 length:909 start_codon:yes stop_codon:yes gene_type:complete